jgi:cation transport ATPase
MSTETIGIIITATLILHGVAHGRALLTLLAVASGGGSSSWLPMRSWAFPSAPLRRTAIVAACFWLPASLGFIASGLAFWGVAVPGDLWRGLAVGSSIISTLGMALFSGTWPGAPSRRLSTLDTAIALAVNAAVLLCLTVLQWPPQEMFGK